MNMPMTNLPGAQNVPWGNEGVPYAYPIALSDLAAWPEWIPSALTNTARGITSSAQSQVTWFNALLAGAVIYTGYRLFKGGRVVHKKVRRSMKKFSYVRQARKSAAKTAAHQFDSEFQN